MRARDLMLGMVLLQHLLNLVRDLLQDQPGSFAPVFHASVCQPLVQQDLARVVHAATLARPHVKGSAQAKERPLTRLSREGLFLHDAFFCEVSND
jgi:hypothetical protein